MNVLISLVLIPTSITTEYVDVALMATVEPGTSQRIVAADVVFGWDPSALRFVGVDNSGAIPALWSGVPTGPQGEYTGINETVPPADGTGMYWWLGQLGIPMIVSQSVKLTTFRYAVIDNSTVTDLVLIPDLTVDYPGETVVYGSNVGGTDVTGDLVNTTVSLCSCDLNKDSFIDSADLTMALAEWTPASNTLLAEILGSWGPCN